MSEYALSNEEKSTIVTTHIKTLEFQKYNVEVSVIEETSAPTISQEAVDQLNEQITIIDAKIAALKTKLAELGN